MYNKLVEVSKKLGVPTKKVLDTLFIIRGGKPIGNNTLLVSCGISRNAINLIKKELKEYLEAPTAYTQLKSSHIEKVSKLFEKDYALEENLLSLKISKQLDLLADRVSLDRKYDQFTATPETVVKRASILDFMADIKDKKILFLGDDDFTSVIVAQLGEAEEISVVDVDERILESINKISKNNSLNIKTYKHDLSLSLPKSLLNRFDIVFTDPPYTPEGINLFLSRAISSLDSLNLASRIYLCYGNSDRAKERYLEIYKIILNSNLLIRWVFDKFNRYHGAESIGSSSSLFVLDTTPKTKPLITKNYDKPIYTNN